MQLTDWLVVILLVAILVVLLDGVRRKLIERRNRVVMKLEKNIPPVDGVDPEELLTKSELPNGGARTLPRQNKPAPTLRNLKSTQKVATASHPVAPVMAAHNLQGVPVLMDAVEVEEDRIEHTNVFADSAAAAAFAADEFGQHPDFDLDSPAANPDSADVDEDYEEDAPMLTPQAAAPQALRDTRYLGRDDEDEDFEEEDDDDLDEDDDEFDDEEDDEFDDELPLPGRVDVEEFDDDELDEDEDEDDFDDDDDDLDDEDDDFDDDEEEDEEDEEDDLDELEGLPEDEWGSEEEQDLLAADDYESEPVLLQDTYSKAASHFSRPERQQRIEPGFGGESFSEEELDEDFTAAHSVTPDELQANAESLRAVPAGRRSAPASRTESAAASAGEDKPVLGRQNQVDLFQETRARTVPRTAERPQLHEQAKAAPPEPVYSGPQEVIIINVMAHGGQYFAGPDLLPLLQQQGLHLGEMSIFHRHADANGSGPIQFSMANMVKPGTFNLATMEEFVTPGVSLFMQMPNKLGNMQSFEQMLKTASALASALDGDLKDEHRSVFTRQTVEHCRQRVRDFELLMLSKKQ